MNFKVGDYVRFVNRANYCGRAENWFATYKVKPSLRKLWVPSDPEENERGTIMIINPIECNAWGASAFGKYGIYVLSDEGKGYLVDENDIRR